MYASLHPLRRTIPAAAFVLALAVSGCGGGSNGAASTTQLVRGPGFTFESPSDRQLARTIRSVTLLPSDEKSTELESVTRFPLVKRFKVSLWPKAMVELDGVASKLAKTLGGTVESKETVGTAGTHGRRYEIAYTRNGEQLRQRIALLLRKRTEYQLLCRWPQSEGEPEACVLLERSFALS